MKINYEGHQKNIGNNKFFKFVGWIFLFAGIFVLITSILDFIRWDYKKNNYIKEYVYSESGTLYYELNDERIYIKNVYNTDDEKITINIPNNKVIIMYIDKNNINDGIYFDLNNSFDQGMLYPAIIIFISLFLVAMGLFAIITNMETRKNKATIKPLFFICLIAFLVGSAIIVKQVYNTINYFNLKSQHNIVTATIYSQIYSGREEDTYKFVAYYYVDGKKYIYVNDYYEEGNFDDKLGNTFELYYDKSNPNKVVKMGNPIDVLILILGIGFAAGSFPFIFLKEKIEEKI